ncbi:MAG: hydroxyacid dehydrogenase [Promethearchaeota archaeon]
MKTSGGFKLTLKIIVTDKLSDKGILKLKTSGFEVKEAWDIPKNELPNIIGQYDALIVRSATKARGELLEKATNLKVIGRAGVGLDNVDLEETTKRNIVVHNTPAATSTSVAELAFTYMMALTRDVVTGTNALRKGEWPKKELSSIEVKGKTLGIVGYGRIGWEFAQRAIAFGMTVLAYKRHPPETPPEGINFVSLDELLEKSDYISLHAPHTEESHHMISTAQFAKMKPGVRIIDCGRGGVMDLDALYEAMKEGKVKGAGLDVFPEEPPGKHKIFELPNVIATPHIGAQTAEGQLIAAEQVAELVIDELNKLK